MKSAIGTLLAAVFVTSMDIEVAARCGPFLWHYWNGIAWARIALLMLAGAMVFTLMDIWSNTLYLGQDLLGHCKLQTEDASSRDAIEVTDV